MTAPTWEILILGLCLDLSLLSLSDRSYATKVIRISDPDLLACWDNPFQAIAKLRLLKYPLGFKRYLKHLLGLRLGSKALEIVLRLPLQLICTAASGLFSSLRRYCTNGATQQSQTHTGDFMNCLCISWTQHFLLACSINGLYSACPAKSFLEHECSFCACCFLISPQREGKTKIRAWLAGWLLRLLPLCP